MPLTTLSAGLRAKASRWDPAREPTEGDAVTCERRRLA